MSIGQFMPLFTGVEQPAKDPNQAYVVVSLHMESNGDGVTLVDSSASPKTFTRGFNGSINSSVKKFGNSSLYLAGSGSFYRMSGELPVSSAACCTELWIMWAGGSSNQTIIHQSVTAVQTPYRVAINTTGCLVVYLGPSLRIETTTTIPTGVWHHVSVGFTGSKYFLYLNGVLLGTYTGAAAGHAWGLLIGSTVQSADNDATQKFVGYIDEIRWWRGVSVRDGTNNFTRPSEPWADY